MGSSCSIGAAEGTAQEFDAPMAAGPAGTGNKRTKASASKSGKAGTGATAGAPKASKAKRQPKVKKMRKKRADEGATQRDNNPNRDDGSGSFTASASVDKNPFVGNQQKFFVLEQWMSSLYLRSMADPQHDAKLTKQEFKEREERREAHLLKNGQPPIRRSSRVVASAQGGNKHGNNHALDDSALKNITGQEDNDSRSVASSKNVHDGIVDDDIEGNRAS